MPLGLGAGRAAQRAFACLGALGVPRVGGLRPVPESRFVPRSPSTVTRWVQVLVTGWGADGRPPAVGGGPQASRTCPAWCHLVFSQGL